MSSGKKIHTFILIAVLSILNSYGQLYSNSGNHFYDRAFRELLQLVDNPNPASFKRAVFVTENAYLNETLSYEAFSSEIERIAGLTILFSKINENAFIYKQKDKEKVLIWASLFNVLTDSVPLLNKHKDTLYHTPYSYDFDDFMGKKNWTKMFVSKLLLEHKGNCHSLPYLYKIIADELHVGAHLSLAPHHIYIKHRCEKTGFYNTELTSATFPIDAWLMASGYINLQAIKSGIYMDTLSNRQAIALCLFDLAKGFERKHGHQNDDFLLLCLDEVLAHYPNCINALLFKSEVLKRKLDSVKGNPIYKEQFSKYEELILKIHQLGYRRMPESMYLNWLQESSKKREMYENKNIIQAIYYSDSE